MKVHKQWADEEKAFDVVCDALENHRDAVLDTDEIEEFEFDYSTEKGDYADQGYIALVINGRKFYLELWEEVRARK